MPRTKEQNEAIRLQRKQAILAAALDVYVEKGYASAEIGEIAKRAELARGLVYYYFKDKAALFRELFLHMIDQSKRNIRSHFGQEGPVLELFGQYVHSMLDNALRNQSHVRFYMRMAHDLHHIFTEQERKELGWPGDYRDVLTEALQRGMTEGTIRTMNPALLARQLWASLLFANMYIVESLCQQNKKDPETTDRLQRDILDAAEGCLSLIRNDHSGPNESRT